MKILKIMAAVAIVVAVVLAVIAPVGPLPGFFIGGNPTPAPERWMDTSAVHEIKLGVTGSLPRVVIIWVVEHADDLYVVGAGDGGWVTMLGQGGPVNMRLEDNTYALQATRVTEGLAPILASYIAKYEPDYPDIVAEFPAAEDAEGKDAEGKDAEGKYGVFRLDRS